MSLLRCYGCRDGTVLGRGLFNMIHWVICVICVICIVVDNLDSCRIGRSKENRGGAAEFSLDY